MTLEDVIQELRALNEPVPNPLRLPTPEEVAQAEQVLGLKFHPDFRKYLLEASDVVYGTLEPVTITVEDEYTDLHKVARDAWESGVSRSLLPVCEDNADFYCINERGEIVYWSHDGPTDEKWPDLATWIQEVWIEEG
jgi:hypothetical protein